MFFKRNPTLVDADLEVAFSQTSFNAQKALSDAMFELRIRALENKIEELKNKNMKLDQENRYLTIQLERSCNHSCSNK